VKRGKGRAELEGEEKKKENVRTNEELMKVEKENEKVMKSKELGVPGPKASFRSHALN